MNLKCILKKQLQTSKSNQHHALALASSKCTQRFSSQSTLDMFQEIH